MRISDWSSDVCSSDLIPTITDVPANNNVSYHIYPNFVMPASESGIPLLQFWPTSNRTSRVVSSWIAPDYHPDQPNPLWETRLANWERILYEDLPYAPQIQESLKRQGFKGIPLNYQERLIYHRSEEHTSELQSLMPIS